MSCLKPVQGFFVFKDGVKSFRYSHAAAIAFYESKRLLNGQVSVPCGQCISCRLKLSRDWAIRMVHELQMSDEACFLTLTFDSKNLLKMCPNGSLDPKHMKDFMKRLKINDERDRSRRGLISREIRRFYCGEYGEKNLRPHYHAIVFGMDFEDKKPWKMSGDFPVYTSDKLSKAWPYGICVTANVSFDSSCYVARYCTKKINGVKAESHYKRLNFSTGELVSIRKEFAYGSTKPAIGDRWFDKYCYTDVYNTDSVVINKRGNMVTWRPPKRYDRLLKERDPEFYEKVIENRQNHVKKFLEDNSWVRLQEKQKLFKLKMSKLLRSIEQ